MVTQEEIVLVVCKEGPGPYWTCEMQKKEMTFLKVRQWAGIRAQCQFLWLPLGIRQAHQCGAAKGLQVTHSAKQDASLGF